MPALKPRFVPSPCDRCGAVNERQAEGICKPSFDEAGDAWCPGSVFSATPDGRLVDYDPTYLAELNEWIGQQVQAG